MKYNHYFANHFGGCMLLARAYDPHRNRNVELRMIPGEFDVVGVTDGTDCWVAPTIANPFSVDVRKILEGIREGRMPQTSKPRHRIVVPIDDERGPQAAQQPQAPKPRVRVTLTDQQQKPIPRRKLNVPA